MSDRHLDGNDLDQRTRIEAYFSWESAGCPAGKDLEHWENARQSLQFASAFPAEDHATQHAFYEGGLTALPPQVVRS